MNDWVKSPCSTRWAPTTTTLQVRHSPSRSSTLIWEAFLRTVLLTLCIDTKLGAVLKKDFSTYLDLMRIAAAVAVFLAHLGFRSISGGFLWQAERYGHSAVVVFFVLSGFVIHFTAHQKERNMFDYLVARFARLYSVVLPALLLTVACDFIGIHHNSSVYYMSHETKPVTDVAWNAVFLSQSWQRVGLLSNAPFWSLNYEFWYYLIFAAAMFLRGVPRVAGVLICSAIAGPAILLLFPIWIMGAIAYRVSRHVKFSPRTAWAAWGVSVLGILIAVVYNIHTNEPGPVFLPSGYSATDYAVGLCFAANLTIASQLEFKIVKAHRPIAYIAGMTFALYLFHLPLLNLAAAFTPVTLPVPVRAAIVSGFALAVIFGLSFVTERQKKRWQGLFRRLFELLRLRRPLQLAVSD